MAKSFQRRRPTGGSPLLFTIPALNARVPACRLKRFTRRCLLATPLIGGSSCQPKSPPTSLFCGGLHHHHHHQANRPHTITPTCPPCALLVARLGLFPVSFLRLVLALSALGSIASLSLCVLYFSFHSCSLSSPRRCLSHKYRAHTHVSCTPIFNLVIFNKRMGNCFYLAV